MEIINHLVARLHEMKLEPYLLIALLIAFGTCAAMDAHDRLSATSVIRYLIETHEIIPDQYTGISRGTAMLRSLAPVGNA